MSGIDTPCVRFNEKFRNTGTSMKIVFTRAISRRLHLWKGEG